MPRERKQLAPTPATTLTPQLRLTPLPVTRAARWGRGRVGGRAGHSVMTDNPDGFRDAVLRFVVGDE